MESKRARYWFAGFVWLAALIVLCCVAGCNSPLAGLPDDAYQAEADAAVDATLAADPVLAKPDDQPKPDDVKPGDTCPSCNGKGSVGDGRISRPCQRCGADGRIDERDLATEIGAEPPIEIQLPEPTPGPEERPIQPEASTRTIVMHVAAEDADGWPREWWRETSPRLASDGWTVTAKRDEDAAEPWFEICEGDRCRKIVGNQPYEAF